MTATCVWATRLNARDGQTGTAADRLLAQGAPLPQPELPREQQRALTILQEARERLSEHKTVRANLLEKVSIPDRTLTASHSFTARGSYLQGKNLQQNLQLRLEFSLQVGGNQGSLLEVCDGQVLWTRHDIAGDTQITRRDVRQILEAARQNGNVPQNLLVAELGLGGLPGLLASFEDSLTFTKAGKQTLDEQTFFVIEGTWSDAFREMIGAARGSGNELPPFVPDAVRIYFDEKTFFPRRILYLKAFPSQKLQRPMLTLDFTQVELDQPVSEDDFLFIPPDQPTPIDITQMYLQRLKPPQQPGAQGQPGQAGQPGPGALPTP